MEQRDYAASDLVNPVHKVVNTWNFREDKTLRNNTVKGLKIAYRGSPPSGTCGVPPPTYQCDDPNDCATYKINCRTGTTITLFKKTFVIPFSPPYNQCETFEYCPCANVPANTTVCNPNYVEQFGYRTYEHISRWFYLEKMEETTDGVTVTTEYQYDEGVGAHTLPLASTVTNSDGTQYQTRTVRVGNFTNINTTPILTEMKNRHMITVPIRVAKYASRDNGNNWELQGGMVVEYDDFGNSIGGVAIHSPKKVFSVLFDENYTPPPSPSNIVTADLPVLLEETVTDYTTDGFPTGITKRDYPEETYQWVEGLLKQKIYNPNSAGSEVDNWTWTYDYYVNSRLPLRVTQLDGQDTEFEYDGLQRLKIAHTKRDSCTTTYDYLYTNNIENTPNQINTTMVYDDGITPTQTVAQTIDGLGRKRITRVNNVIKNEVRYDGVGRVRQQTHLPSNFVTLEYDNSPLRRLTKQIFPDGNFTTTQYEKEVVVVGNEDNAMNGETDDQSYYQTIATDENGNATTTLTDKLGRTYLTRNALNGETQYEYNDRHLPTYIHSPKADKPDVNNPNWTTSTPELVYAYTYTNRSQIKTKYVPSMEVGTVTDFEYDYETGATKDRSLLVQVTDAANDILNYEYDVYGREVKTKLNGGDIITSAYDTGDAINVGKLVSKSVISLDGSGTFNYAYKYDQHGRLDTTAMNNHLGGIDTMFNQFNLADWQVVARRRHTSNVTYGNQDITIKQNYKYDVFGRQIESLYQIGATNNLANTPAVTLYTQQWNDRDQLVNKTLGGGLQSIDYLYNERGWLRQINQPLDVFTDDPLTRTNCTTMTSSAMEMEEMAAMTFCGSVTADLNELLSIRFDSNISIDCYNPCATSAMFMTPPDCTSFNTNGNTKRFSTTRYTLQREIPCAGGTQMVTRPNIASFPMEGDTLYRILRCDGSEYYCWSDDLPTDEDYLILQEIPISSPQQVFAINENCGESQIVGVEGLILAVGQDAENIAIDNYVLTESACSPKPPNCTELEQAEQQDYIANLMANPLTSDSLNYPFYLVRVKLCNGDEVHLTAAELRDLPHAYVELQRLFVADEAQSFQVGLPVSNLDTKDLFYQSLHYDETNNDIGNTAYKNGNISYQTWQTKGRNEQYYHYTYDELDRIKTAVYGERTEMEWEQTDLYNTTFLQYDANGNIGRIFRSAPEITGMGTFGCASQIDNLTLKYNGNRISTIKDAPLSGDATRGFKANTNDELSYNYDDKGNLTFDPHKDLTIDYNHLNLPDFFNFSDTASIQIFYDAEGRKLQKRASSDNKTQQTKDYCSGFEYENTGLVSVYNDEGRVVYDNGSWEFQYNIRDHLGNTRILFREDVIGDSLEVLQEEHYYAFGGRMDGEWNTKQLTTEHDYLYNGKERNDNFGLGWSDFGARWYMDGWLPIFPTVDPIIEEFPYLSSYNYASLNPVTNVDLWGLQGAGTNEKTAGKEVKTDNYTDDIGKGLASQIAKRVGTVVGLMLDPQELGTGSVPYDLSERIRTVNDEKENSDDKDDDDYDYFYRAMSLDEYEANAGFVRPYEGGKGLPFITTNIDYLSDLIDRPQHAGMYEIIVRFKTKKGTENDLLRKSRKFDANRGKGSIKKARALNFPVRKMERGYLNFGFPGNSAAQHLDPNLVEPPKPILIRR